METEGSLPFLQVTATFNFLPLPVVTSNHKWQQCSQTYTITTVRLSSSSNVFIRQPSNSDMAWDRYVTPFSYGLWLAAAITGCALGVCLAITNFSNKSNQRLSLVAAVFYIPSCLCQQGQKINTAYEFFILSFVLPGAKFFFPFLLFWPFLIFFCHSYLYFNTWSMHCTNLLI